MQIGIILIIVIFFVFTSWLVLQKIRKPDSLKVKALFQATVPLSATLIGVFLALSLNACQQKKNTINNLKNVIIVAKSEAMESYNIIKEGPQRADELGQKDKERLVLEFPAKALDVLVSMPSFLEYGESEIVTELLTLNTSLKWNAPNRTGGGLVMSSVEIETAHPTYVLTTLERVVELLEKQLEKL